MWEYLWEKQNGKCCYCEKQINRYDIKSRRNFAKAGREPPDDFATKEHLVRKTNGGKLEKDNIAWACRPCNRDRGGIDWFTYKTYKMGELFT